MRAIRKCGVSACTEAPYLGGLCRHHHEQESSRRELRDKAVTALHTLRIDGRWPDDLLLRKELLDIHGWWTKACSVVKTGLDSALMPHDEAEYALEWCIALAQEIVLAEVAVRSGEETGSTLACTKLWVWERFKNLEAGLCSNGMPRRA